MRLKNTILAFGVVLAGLSSCMKDEMYQNDGLVTFNASFNNAATKTVLEGMTPHWTPTDKISIYDGENNEFVNSSSEVSASTSFKGTLNGKGRKYYLAAYPYSPDLSFAFLSKTVYSMVMPTEQTAVAGSYDPSAAKAIAYTEDFNLSFKNVCSLIKFKIISDGVQSVTVKANAGENLAGKFNATWSASPNVVVTAGEKEVTLNGDFKNGETYYIVTIPVTLTEGMTVTLNGTVVTMKETYQIDLARSGMVNLGDLSLDPSESQKPENPDQGEDEAVASDWGLMGAHNSWDVTNPTPMYEIGSNFVAFDVPASAGEGMKFKNGDTWIGTTATVALDTWVTAQGEGGQDIKFTATEGATYDVYFANSLNAFYITIAGGASPGPMPKPFSGMAVAGTFNSWSTSASPAVEEGEYYTLKGIKAAMTNAADAGDRGFKFVYTESDGNMSWYGASVASVAPSKWYNVSSDPSASNIFVSGGDATSEYDVYMTKDRRTFCVVPAGGDIPSADEVGGTEGGGTEDGGTEEDNPGTGSTTHRLIVKVTTSIDWYDKYLYTWDSAGVWLTGGWPGTKLNWDKQDGNYYVYYYDLPASMKGQTINYIINGGMNSGQTKDLAVTLSNGDSTIVTIETSHKK